MDEIENILQYWFGDVEKAALPSEHRIWTWLATNDGLDAEIRKIFEQDLVKAINGEYDHWKETPRGLLAWLILLDQFSRRIYRNTPKIFEQDAAALHACLMGMESGYDHQLSLFERIFFYFPLMHSESLDVQTLSVLAYKKLASVAFSESRPFFSHFLSCAISHRDHIKEFGRFPHRNTMLGRPSTEAELVFLKDLESAIKSGEVYKHI